jgi:hypothetical protein
MCLAADTSFVLYLILHTHSLSICEVGTSIKEGKALGGTLLNVGVTLNSQGNQLIANGSFVGAGTEPLFLSSIFLPISYINNLMDDFLIKLTGVMMALALRSMQKVRKLDKFETMI